MKRTAAFYILRTLSFNKTRGREMREKKKRSTICLERTRKGHHQSDQPARTRKGHRQSDQKGEERAVVSQTSKDEKWPSSIRPARMRKGHLNETSKDEKESSSVRPARTRKGHPQSDQPARTRKGHRQLSQQGRERAIVNQTSTDEKGP